MNKDDIRVASQAVENLRTAYYSLLQYSPGASRNERVNIAVLLEAPGHGYLRAKYLRYMRKLIECVDPAADFNLVYAAAQHLENTLKGKEQDIKKGEALFPEVYEPTELLRLNEILAQSLRTPIELTEPKLIMVPEQQRFEDRLNYLYEKMVARPRVDKPEPLDKRHVREYVFNNLSQRDIDLETDPLPVRGAFYEENEFDAAYRNGKSSYFQFFSFDSESPDISQVKVFLTSVQDIREGGIYVPEKGFHYLAVVRPPIRHRGNIELFNRASQYLDKKRVPVFLADENHLNHIEGLAEFLRSSSNASPWDYRPS